MNEMEQSSQVSALFDAELDPGESDLVVRRLLKDPALQADWRRYALVGAALRGEPLMLARTSGRGDVASRVRARLADEAPLVGAAQLPLAKPAATRTAGYRRAAWGTALAASVAAASIMMLRVQAPATDGAALVAATSAPVSAVAALPVAASPEPAVARAASTVNAGAAPGYTTPVDSRPNGLAMSAPLVDYVVAHSEYTTPVVRFSPLTTVINGNFDPAANTVEMTEAEVGARR